jgi:hypothetical protein
MTAIRKEASNPNLRATGRSLCAILLWYNSRCGVGWNEVVKMQVWILAIVAFWKITNLIPSKMSLEFARSSDRENKMLFLETFHAVWFLR